MSENTLLAKARQCLTEKLSNLSPEVLKQGVTAFNVEGELIPGMGYKINSDTMIKVDGAKLASLIDGQVTAEEKLLELHSTSGYPNLIPIFAGYEPIPAHGDFTSILVCLTPKEQSITLSAITSANYTSEEIKLIELATIDIVSSRTGPLYNNMTIGSLIEILGIIGTVEVKLNTTRDFVVSRLYSSYISASTDSVSRHVLLPANDTSNIIELYAEESLIIGYGDEVTFYGNTLADIIEENTTAEEKAAYLNGYDSGKYSPSVELAEGIYGDKDSGTGDNTTIAIQHDYNITDKLSLVASLIRGDYTDVTDPLIVEDSCTVIVNPMTVSQLIGLLRKIGDKTLKAGISGGKVVTFHKPSSIRLLGPTIDKVIDVSATILGVE